MPQRIFTSDELILFVRRQARIPNKDVTGGRDADILELLNESLYSIIVPVLRQVREEYFVFSQRIVIPIGAKRIPIPTRAVGRQIRDVCYFDGSERQRIQVIQREHLTSFSVDVTTGSPTAIYLEGNDMVFADNYAGGGHLEVSFLALPGQLVPLSEGRLITGVDGSNKTFTVDPAVPASWDEGTPKFDVHGPHSGADLRQIALTTDDVDNLTIIVNESIDGSVYGTTLPVAGDYICLTGEAVIPALPIEWHIPLGWAAISMWHQSQGNFEHAAAAKQTLAEMMAAERLIAKTRVESHPKRHVSQNPLWGGASYTGGLW